MSNMRLWTACNDHDSSIFFTLHLDLLKNASISHMARQVVFVRRVVMIILTLLWLPCFASNWTVMRVLCMWKSFDYWFHSSGDFHGFSVSSKSRYWNLSSFISQRKELEPSGRCLCLDHGGGTFIRLVPFSGEFSLCLSLSTCSLSFLAFSSRLKQHIAIT